MSDFKIGPWLKHSSKVQYQNPWIHVRQDEVTTPGGFSGIYGVVEYQNRALGVVPILDSGKIVLVGQHRYPLDNYSWEIPEGGGPLDEDMTLAIQRELKEETGYIAHKWHLIASEIELSNSVSNEQAWIWVAQGLIAGEAEPEPCEELRLQEVTWDEAFQMIDQGQIRDAMSIIGLYRAREYLNQKP